MLLLCLNNHSFFVSHICNLLYKSEDVCLCVCVCVRLYDHYRNPNGKMYGHMLLARINEVEQMERMLGKSERIHQNYQRKIETGRGSHIDVGQIESGEAKWRGGASL